VKTVYSICQFHLTVHLADYSKLSCLHNTYDYYYTVMIDTAEIGE